MSSSSSISVTNKALYFNTAISPADASFWT